MQYLTKCPQCDAVQLQSWAKHHGHLLGEFPPSEAGPPSMVDQQEYLYWLIEFQGVFLGIFWPESSRLQPLAVGAGATLAESVGPLKLVSPQQMICMQKTLNHFNTAQATAIFNVNCINCILSIIQSDHFCDWTMMGCCIDLW